MHNMYKFYTMQVMRVNYTQESKYSNKKKKQNILNTTEIKFQAVFESVVPLLWSPSPFTALINSFVLSKTKLKESLIPKTKRKRKNYH